MDKQDSIVRQAKLLPIEVRKDIVKRILDSIDRDSTAVSAAERLKELVPLAETAFEIKYEPTSRNERNVYVRNAIAWVMRNEGYTFTSIGKAMGKTPCSVISMVKRADDMAKGYCGPDVQSDFDYFMQQI